jgi:hypothetical protein
MPSYSGIVQRNLLSFELRLFLFYQVIESDTAIACIQTDERPKTSQSHTSTEDGSR